MHSSTMVYQEVATVCSVCKFVVKDELMNADEG
jgi:hypothetical protein